VYSFSNVFLTAVIALLAGGGIGFLLSRQMSADIKKTRELERNVDRLLKQQRDYQHGVTEHFTDTAKLLNTLAESYRDVHNHLATGAASLCNDNSASILGRIPDGSMLQLTEAPNLEAIQPPLDYAPKSSPYETGMLNEEFGLEKPAQEEVQAPSPADHEQPIEEKA
jgi:uncharacterized membrane-anchored protein YhcB (DUF1043 family)